MNKLFIVTLFFCIAAVSAQPPKVSQSQCVAYRDTADRLANFIERYGKGEVGKYLSIVSQYVNKLVCIWSLSECQSVRISICQSICMSIYRFVSLSVCLYVSLFMCPYFRLSVCQSIRIILSVNICPYASLSLCQNVSMSVYLYVCQS